MDHRDLAVLLADWADLDLRKLDEQQLDPLLRDLTMLVVIEQELEEINADSNESRKGFGIVKFREQSFYSVRIGNLARDKLGTLGLVGSLLTSGATLAGLVAAGTLSTWAGAGALVAIAFALVGRAKPFVATFGLDEATTLDLAWRKSRIEHGFRLVDAETLAGCIGEVEATYGNAGFTRAKLTNALNKLEAIGMIKGAGGDSYQLVERLKFSDADHLKISAG